MGIMDAIWQNYACEYLLLFLSLGSKADSTTSLLADWLMGTMSNSSSQLAHLVGLYKVSTKPDSILYRASC